MRYEGPTQYVQRMIELHGDQRTPEEIAEDEAKAAGTGGLTVTTREVEDNADTITAEDVDDEQDDGSAASIEPEALDDLTLVQLQAHARQAGVSQQGTKAEIRDRLLEKQGARPVIDVNAEVE